MEPLISIIVPVFNVEDYLDRCLKSIVSQTYKNLQIILVDDGTEDNSGALCDAWAKRDNRIVVIHQKNGGLSNARNTGIDKADGEYIAFIDSDDCINERYCELLYDALRKTGNKVAVCDFVEFSDDNELIKFKNNEYNQDIKVITGKELLERLLCHNGWHLEVTWNKLYDRSLFEELRFEEGKIHEDEFIIHRIAILASKITILEQKLYYYYKNNNSIMAQKYSEKRLYRTEAYIDRVERCYKFMGPLWCAKMLWQIRIQILEAKENNIDISNIDIKKIKIPLNYKIVGKLYFLYRKIKSNI